VRASLAVIESLEYDWLVPAHGRVCDRDEALEHTAHHRERIDAQSERLHTLLAEPLTTEAAIAAVSREVGLSDDPAQYWLAVTTVKGYLSDLLRLGRAEFFVREHAGWWRAI
jgi:hypothetical protein